MKKLLIFIISVVLMGSCSSEKTLSEQIKYDWDINYSSSKDDVNERPYNPIKNLKNSSVQNQSEVQASLPSSKNNQDFLASNDKAEPSDLKNNYSYKKSPQIIQNESKSFNEKPQIFENEKSSVKKLKIKDKKNKILWIIVSTVFIAATIFMYLFNLLLFVLDEPLGGITVLPISTLLTYLSFSSLKKISESNSKKDNKNKDRDSRKKEKNKSLKYTLFLTIIFLAIALITTVALNS